MPRHEEGFFSTRDGVRLFWTRDQPEGRARAAVGLVHGFADHVGRYRAPIEAFVKQGLDVHAFDFRGHGKSEGRRGHVNRFPDYLGDLELFYARLLAAAPEGPVFLLGHSNGGLVSLRFCAQPHDRLAGLIVTSPYLELALKPPRLKLWAGQVLDHLLPWLPFGNELKVEHLSHDPAWQKSTREDPLYGRTVTPRWFSETTAAQKALLGAGPQIRLPLLMLVGAEDPIASVPRSRAFFQTVGSADKRYQEYPSMRHEILHEIGKEQVWHEILSWISAHV